MEEGGRGKEKGERREEEGERRREEVKHGDRSEAFLEM